MTATLDTPMTVMAIAAPALVLSLGYLAWQRRKEPLRNLEAALRPISRYWVRARIAPHDEARARIALEPVLRKYDDLDIDPDPPRAGPEIEITFPLHASHEEHAERHGRRRLERAGISVYAIAARRI